MRHEADSEPNPTTPGPAPPKAGRPQPGSTAVVLRFAARMLILIAFASIGTIGFAGTFEALLTMAAIYCSAIATLRRDAPFGPVLTHFDEAAAYALCALVVSRAA